MRASSGGYVDNLRKLASILATLIIGMTFSMVTSVNAAAPPVKNNAGKAKIENVEAIAEAAAEAEVEAANEAAEAALEAVVPEAAGSKAFNRQFLLDNIRLNNNKVFIKPFFNKGR